MMKVNCKQCLGKGHYPDGEPHGMAENYFITP